jgi:hypothetical protein
VQKRNAGNCDLSFDRFSIVEFHVENAHGCAIRGKLERDGASDAASGA